MSFSPKKGQKSIFSYLLAFYYKGKERLLERVTALFVTEEEEEEAGNWRKKKKKRKGWLGWRPYIRKLGEAKDAPPFDGDKPGKRGGNLSFTPRSWREGRRKEEGAIACV